MKSQLFLLTIAAAVFCSCKAVDLKSIPGEYKKSYSQKENYTQTITLKLNNDSSFDYSDKWFEVNNVCQGQWKYIAPKTILLQCFQYPSTVSVVAAGYMSGRQLKVRIVAKNKLKVDKSIFQKVQ